MRIELWYFPLCDITRGNLSIIRSSRAWWFNAVLTCLAHATADGINDDKDDEYRREDNADYGSARYQWALMLQHAGIYTLKDDKSTSFLNIFVIEHACICISQFVSAKAILNDVWWWLTIVVFGDTSWKQLRKICLRKRTGIFFPI